MFSEPAKYFSQKNALVKSVEVIVASVKEVSFFLIQFVSEGYQWPIVY